VYCIKQQSRHHCFPACLVSFFSGLQLPLIQNEIVNRCPNLFYKVNDIEGLFTNSNDNLNKVANEFNINIKIVFAINIRLNKTSKLIYFMNPSISKIKKTFILNT